ncbi:MAG: nitroreductase family protein [Acidimicrobiales bacterium]
MEFQEVVRRRRMVRNFDDRPLSPELVERIIANGLRGPSAGFTQGTELLVLQGRAETGRYWAACLPPERRVGFRWAGLLRAPLLVVPLAHPQAYFDRYAEADKDRPARRSGWQVPYWHVDASFSTLLILLTAVDAGLGALFFGVFQPDAFRAEFGVPEAYVPLGAIAIGFRRPDEPSPSLARGRRPGADMVHRGRW